MSYVTGCAQGFGCLSLRCDAIITNGGPLALAIRAAEQQDERMTEQELGML